VLVLVAATAGRVPVAELATAVAAAALPGTSGVFCGLRPKKVSRCSIMPPLKIENQNQRPMDS
jgi:hypothetical protein